VTDQHPSWGGLSPAELLCLIKDEDEKEDEDDEEEPIACLGRQPSALTGSCGFL
jgi:hypothetical protein